MRGDLIETYKILTGMDRLGAGRMFSLVEESRGRGHNLRTRGRLFRIEMRKEFFTDRVMKLWNSLSQETVDQSLNVFQIERGNLFRF